MSYRKIIIAAFLLFSVLYLSAADAVWEGTAAMSRYGEFPVKGLYGASNSFPVNTVISVENPVSRKKLKLLYLTVCGIRIFFSFFQKTVQKNLK